VISV